MTRERATPWRDDPPALEPVVLDAESAERLQRARRRALWLDSLFRVPGTDLRFGVEPIIGLFPWAGDAAAALLALTLVWDAHCLGLPGVVKARMLFNIVVDVLVGSIPVIGDAWDFFFKANQRNLQVMERAVSGGRRAARTADWLFVAATSAAALALVSLPFLVAAALLLAIAALVR